MANDVLWNLVESTEFEIGEVIALSTLVEMRMSEIEGQIARKHTPLWYELGVDKVLKDELGKWQVINRKLGY